MWGHGSFETPLGPLTVDAALARALGETTSLVRENSAVHEREHSLELQLPFVARLFPDLPILPLLVGHQHRATVTVLGDALAEVLRGREPLIVASSESLALSTPRSRCTTRRRGRALRRAE